MPDLTPRERAVLDVLVRHRGAVVDRATLAAEAGVGERSRRRVDSLVAGLRRALGDAEIVTVRGRGWRVARGADA